MVTETISVPQTHCDYCKVSIERHAMRTDGAGGCWWPSCWRRPWCINEVRRFVTSAGDSIATFP